MSYMSSSQFTFLIDVSLITDVVYSTLRSLLFMVTIFCELVV